MNIPGLTLPLGLAAVALFISAAGVAGGLSGITMRLGSLRLSGSTPVVPISGISGRAFLSLLLGNGHKEIGDRALSRFVILARFSYPFFLVSLGLLYMAAKSGG